MKKIEVIIKSETSMTDSRWEMFMLVYYGRLFGDNIRIIVQRIDAETDEVTTVGDIKADRNGVVG